MINQNEHKKGYKLSPLGWIPEEWEVIRLKDLLEDARLGGNYENSTAHTGIPVIKMGNLGRGKITVDELQYLPSNCAYSEGDVLQNGDLLFNTRNTLELVGKVAIWQNELPLAVYNSNILRFKFCARLIENNHYMNWVFNSFYGLKQLRGFATGTTSVAAIYGRDLENFKCIIPPKIEQRHIATILSTWDLVISKTQQLIVQLQQRNKGLMQQLLTGKKRLKGFEDEDWKKLNANEIFKSVSVKNKYGEQLLSATQDKGIIPRSMLEARVTMPTGETASFKLVEKGDFVISLRSFQGGIEYSEYRGLVSPAYTVLKPSRQISNSYYKHYFKSYDFIGHLAVAVIGIRDGKQISYEDFSFLKLPYPSVKEQEAIAIVLDSAVNEVKLYEQKISKLQQQKKGLMQKLLTGEVRVKIDQHQN